MPRMPLSGVRTSCDTMARKRDLAALAIAPYDQVALRLEQARGTLLGFLQLPHVVGKLLPTGGGAAQRNALALVARGHHQDDAAGDGEEPTDADREQRRIVDRFVDV